MEIKNKTCLSAWLHTDYFGPAPFPWFDSFGLLNGEILTAFFQGRGVAALSSKLLLPRA
jgi:hypothetical protein